MILTDNSSAANAIDSKPVSEDWPCRVCGRVDACHYTGPDDDPLEAICSREPSDLPFKEGGWRHLLRKVAPPLPCTAGDEPTDSADATAQVPCQADESERPAGGIASPSPTQGCQSASPDGGPDLPLFPSHSIDLLNRSGLSPEMIRQSGIYSELDRDTVANMLNWKNFGKNGMPVMVFLYFDRHGQVVQQRVKPDRPITLGGDKPAKYLSPKGAKVRMYFPPAVWAAVDDLSEPLFITEGEKKALKATQEGFPCLSIPGVTCWHKKDSDELHPDLGQVAWDDRRVYVVFDSDAASNENVRKNEEGLAAALRAAGAVPHVVRLPAGEKGKKVGLDDYLVANERQAFEKLVASTKPWEPTVEPWGELEPYEELLLPEFPVEVLPSPLREWVSAESTATQTPPDLAALLGLAVCGSAVARNISVEPRKGWREPVNIYAAIVLEPANRKSAVFDDATRPLRDVEREEIEAAREAVAADQSRRRQAKAKLEKLEKDQAKSYTAARAAEAEELAKQLANWPEQVLPRRIVDDATHEKLGMMLAEQNGRIASMSPEGGVFDLMAGQYSKSGMPAFGVYLMGHSGDQIQTDRVTRKSVAVERPAVTIAYAIQPAVIQGLGKHSAFRGKGLLARFLYAVPKSWIGEREIAPPWVPDDVVGAYHQLVRQLCKCELEGQLYLDDLADAVFLQWEEEIEDRLGDGGELDVVQDWGGKLAGHTLRLAGIMHCIRHANDNPLQHEIDAETISAAIKIANYLIPHAEVIITQMCVADGEDGPGVDKLAQTLLKWVVRKDKRRFSKRDAHQDISRFKRQKVEALDPVLTDLIERNYLRNLPSKASGRGRPPSPEYEVNPAVFEQKTPISRSQNPQKSTNDLSVGNFEDSETPPVCCDERANCEPSADFEASPERERFEL